MKDPPENPGRFRQDPMRHLWRDESALVTLAEAHEVEAAIDFFVRVAEEKKLVVTRQELAAFPDTALYLLLY